MTKTQVKSKRPAKAAKVSGKVKTAPTKVRRLGGASAANAVHSSAEDRNMRAYDSGMRDGAALAEAQAGLEKLKASQKGLGAARVELIKLESGVDIAAGVAAKHIPPPSDKEKEEKKAADNARSEAGEEIDGALTRPVHSIETHGELALALESLGEWLSEVEKVTGKGKPKARWRRILDPQGAIFSTKKRKVGDTALDRYFITKQDAMRLKGGIRKAVKAAQKAGDEEKRSFMAPILVALEKRPSACVDFLTAYYQRHTGARGDVIARKAALAEALANNNEQPRKVGQSKEQARKTLENDLAWIRSRKRSH